MDSRLANEGDPHAGSGANPWHLDNETESVLFLTNVGDRPSRIGFQIQAGGVHYYLTDLKLNPRETRAIDIRKLRDAQKADFKGNKIPAGATDGDLLWSKMDSVPVVGRVVVFNRGRGLASNFDCQCTFKCPKGFVAISESPTSATAVPGGTTQFTCMETWRDCNGFDLFFDVTGSAGWTSSNTAVATVNDTTLKGLATGVAGGSATITATFTDSTFVWSVAEQLCKESFVTMQANATCDVQKPQFLLRVSSSVSDGGACGGSSCQTLIQYRVLDANGTPILRSGMEVRESVNNFQNFCNATVIDASVWQTDSSGNLIGADSQNICCQQGQNCLFTDDQQFTVNGFPVLVTWDVLNGPTGSHNHIQLTCSNGHGTCAVVTPTP